jgi:hypothetical protein
MSRFLAIAAAAGIMIVAGLPSAVQAGEQSTDGVKTSQSIEVSAARRHHRSRHYTRRYYHRPHYGYYRDPYYAYGYDPYYRRGPGVYAGPFGFGVGIGW